MRRAVLTLGGTVAGLAALFSFKTHVPGVAAASTQAAPANPSAGAPPAAAPDGSASAAPTGGASGTAGKAAPRSPAPAPPKTPVARPTTRAPQAGGSGTTPASTRPVTTPVKALAGSAAPTSAKPTPAARTITGPQEQTQYGPVQVTITVAGTKITSASGSTLGQGDEIGQGALPQLNSEVTAAQGAGIQAVSGATYTSNGYIESLQSAVDQAGL